MTEYVGSFIREERVKKNLNRAELSRKMGYLNINRGVRRIIDLEHEGIVLPEALGRIADALNLDEEYIYINLYSRIKSSS